MGSTRYRIPILDLSLASKPGRKPELLEQLRAALFDVGFLYVTNHGVPQTTISALTDQLPALFDLPESERASLSKLNSPHFLGYSGFAEETTLGKQDLREQFDFATELPVVYGEKRPESESDLPDGEGSGRDFTKLYWRLRGPNQWPSETAIPGFRDALTRYHDAVQELTYDFVHLIEEAFGIPVGTFDHFFGRQDPSMEVHEGNSLERRPRGFLPPQHRIKLLKYPTLPTNAPAGAQGVGAHKDSSGWLTFLYQVGNEPGLEVLGPDGEWIAATPIAGSFVVNFGNAFEAATMGAVKATVHRVVAPAPGAQTRYSIPFFQGLPLDMTVSEIQSFIPHGVKAMRREAEANGQNRNMDAVSNFLDPRWDSLGESQLRKWTRSHKDVALKWYGPEVVQYYAL